MLIEEFFDDELFLEEIKKSSIFYHGSNAVFQYFNVDEDSFSLLGKGIYFYKNKEYAKKYGPNLYKVVIPNWLKIAPKNYKLNDTDLKNIFSIFPSIVIPNVEGKYNFLWWATDGYSIINVDRKKLISRISTYFQHVLNFDGMLTNYPNGGDVLVLWKNYNDLQITLEEASFGKTLGSAALALGLGMGGNSLYKFANPPAPVLHHAVAHTSDEGDAPSINTLDTMMQSEKPNQSNTVQQTPEQIKKAFILKIKPLIDKENDSILSDRNFLIHIENKSNLDNHQTAKFQLISKKYGSNDIKELLSRVDVIPTVLTLSQAALESGWGSSKFAVNNHSLFGQKASRDSNDFASYANINQSVQAYMHNLNTNPAYKKFRQARYYMRKHGDELNPILLARTLVAYDSTGNKYTKKIQNMVKNVIPKAEELASSDD
jgi:Bax protein